MESPSFDLGSYCSSPLLYREGEDFLGQPVNTFFEEDNSFDFIDTFEAGLSIADNVNEVSTTQKHEKDQNLITESSLVSNTQQGHESSKENYFINSYEVGTSSVSGNEQAKESYNKNSVSLLRSTPECINTCTNGVNPSDENADSSTLSKNAEGLTLSSGGQKATETGKEPSRTGDKNLAKKNENETLGNTTATAVLPEDRKKNFQQSTYINNTLNENTTVDKVKLSSEEHATCEKASHANNKDRKSIRATDFRRPVNDNSFALKNSAFKRCVVPKTFYSPFWTPEKSTAKHEKSLEDGLVNAQRNMDILYCCNCKLQKRDSKLIGIAMKPSTLTSRHRDASNKYIDFLKRNSVAKPPDRRKKENKTINGEISGHVCNEANNGDRWISLPAIRTSFKTPRQRASLRHREVGASFTRTHYVAPIDSLINKYKGMHFDLAEQQKRYQLKPFK